MKIITSSPPGQSTAPTWLLAAGLVLAAGTATALPILLGWVASHTGVDPTPGDLSVYQEAARLAADGRSPYGFALDGYPFVYPPFAAVLLTPLALLSLAAAHWWWTLASVLALQVTVWLLLGRLGMRGSPRRSTLTLLATLALLPLSPVAGTLVVGNVNILLMSLVLADLCWLRGRYQGIALGVAAGIKLTPLIFIPYLLFTGRSRAAATATASFLGTVAVGFLILPSASLSYWSGMFLDSSRTRPPGEEAYGSSLRGALLRLLPDGLEMLWLPAGAAAAATGLAIAVAASRHGAELTGVTTVGLTSLLVSPVTWYMHWVWCVPVLALVATDVRRRGPRTAAGASGALWLVFAVPLPWWAVHSAGLVAAPESTWLMPAELLLLLTGCWLLALVAVDLRRDSPRISI